MSPSKETGEPQKTPDLETQPESKKPDFKEDDSNQSSPRCVLETPVLGTGIDSDNSSTSSSSSSRRSDNNSNNSSIVVDSNNGSSQHWRNMFDVIKMKSIRRLYSFQTFKSSDISKRSLNKKLARIRSAEDRMEYEGEPFAAKPSWRSFDYGELVAATDNFCSENLIGKGGNGEVYKGLLSDGQPVAVKRLMRKKKKEDDARTGDFLSELGTIAHIDHPNAAHLLGYGVDGGLHLVLQYSPHGSLATLLHSSEECLEWGIRYRVAIGVAKGLQYLHRGCHRRIIHRDIKASNILLTKDFEPQISDFGLAKWLPEKWNHHIVFPIEGTFGYLAPEYFMHGIVDEKTDVFAYGVLLLELITGRVAVDSSRQSLVMWAKPLLDENEMKELVDPRLGEDYNDDEMKNVMSAASMCIHHLSTKRPHMSGVLQILRGENEYAADARRGEQRPSSAGRSVIIDGCDLEDYTCSRYLNDLNRHRELALE
ncbi:hypothetical protein GIB67_019582 [Kingdonia uniflora]|uniref:non-specific serine/threonine protein kinase n=1 Tax=Kingdonia uniflora TaxID=39325 RepID=A0A7J7N0W7_9MAGN|nr:hypothetical protein GIB67_019582 [Kingdonia uniflora]